MNEIKIETNKNNPPIGNAEGRKKFQLGRIFSPKSKSLTKLKFLNQIYF